MKTGIGRTHKKKWNKEMTRKNPALLIQQLRRKNGDERKKW